MLAAFLSAEGLADPELFSQGMGAFMGTVLVIDDQFASRQMLAELAHSFDSQIQVEAFSSPHDALRWLG